MDSDEERKPEITASVRNRSVRVEILGLITGSAVLGAAAAVSLMRAVAGGVETVSTTGLLGFLLTLGLSVAAIVLSVCAVSLCRATERVVVQRAEEMRAMQVEIISQTTAAIKRIETSVQQTVKETSGVLSGGFETLSLEIQKKFSLDGAAHAGLIEAVKRSLVEQEAPRAAEETAHQPVPEPEHAEEIKQLEAVVLSGPAASPVSGEILEKAEKKYSEFKDIVLLGVANYPGVISRKVGEGQYRTEGDDLVDGAFVLNNERVAVCTFCTNEAIAGRFIGETGDSFNVFLRSLVNELKCGHFTRVFLVFDGKLSNDSPYARSLNTLNSRIDAETFACFELFEGSPDIIIPELTERVSRLMEAVPAAADDGPELSFRRQVSA